MAVWSLSSVNNLHVDRRMDAEFYQPKYQAYESAVKNVVKVEKLGTLGDFVIGPFGSAFDTKKYENTSEYRYIRGRDVKPFVLLDDDNRYIPESDYLRLARYHVRDNDIFISVVGTLGNAAVCPTSGVKAVFSCKSTVFRQRKIDAYYLLSYLNTKYGYNLLIRRQRGAVQGGLNAPDLSSLPIPRFESAVEKGIGALVKKSIKLRNVAKESYSSAETILSKALKMDTLRFVHPLSYTANFSDVMAQGRADADYFQIPYVQLRERILESANGYVPITDLCDFLKPNIDPSKAPKEQFRYVELADINSGLGLVDKRETYSGAALPSRARRQVKSGDVLASAVVGSIDKSAVVGRDQNDFIASTGFFHLRPKPGVPSEFLLMLMRSPVVQMQLKQQATGGILSSVPDSRVKYVLVPRIDAAVQKEVAKLVKAAHKKHGESLSLLEEAKARVEQLIEEAANRA